MSCLPRTRNELRIWCLRKLGEPVIEVNVDEDQVEDRITEALSYYNEYHFDGSEVMWLKHKVTASEMRFASEVPEEFDFNEKLVGQTSGAIAEYYDKAEDNLSIRFITIEGTFQDGEEVVSSNNLISATLAASNAITIGDIDNRYISLPDEILGIQDVLPFNSSFFYGSGMFDVRYQWALHNVHSLISGDLITFDMWKKHLALWQFEFEGIKNVRFNRKSGNLYIDVQWSKSLIDTYILVKALRMLDPSQVPDVYGDYFVREYAKALIQQQWAQNLSKYREIQLPGGVTLNVDSLMSEAKEQLEKLEERLQKEFQLPIDFEVG